MMFIKSTENNCALKIALTFAQKYKFLEYGFDT